jgi:NADH dehydrogenase/NADH:ubiquinone oxidoreductase subunit G
VPTEFDKGINKAAELMRKFEGTIHFIGSSRASLESNFALKALANQLSAHHKLFYVSHVEKGWGDNFLRRDDRSPNTKGCEMLGMEAININELKARISDGEFKFVYMLEDTAALEVIAGANLGHCTVIAHATNHVPGLEKLDVVLPAASEIETESIFVNEDGKAQYTKMAKQISQMTPEMWMRVPKSRLDKAAVAIDRWRNVENIYDVLPSWRMISMISKHTGKDLMLKEHKDVVSKLKSEFSSLRELNVSYKVPKEAFKITQYDFAVK